MQDPQPSRAVVLLVAHGSRNPDAATAHERLCEEVQERSTADGAVVTVRPAYLEIAEPTIPAAIDAAVAEGARRVRLLPHFLAPGNHVQRDLPRIVDEARERHPEAAIDLEEHTGADPGMAELLAARVRG